MSLYLILWIVICVYGFKDYLITASYMGRRREYLLILLILTAMLAFRFGQGTDYFGYRHIYNSLSPKSFDISVYSRLHGEIGYLLICNLFRCLGASFEVFVSFTAIFEMLCFYRFSKEFKIDTPFTLVLAYPTLYMTYFYSAIRQGIVTAAFLGLLLPLFLNKKYKFYFVLSFICVLIHSASITFFFLLFAKKIKKISSLQWCCLGAWCSGFVLITPIGRRAITALGISGLNYYMSGSANISMLSVLERIFFIFVVSKIYDRTYKENKITESYKALYICYLVSMSLYGFFIGYGIIASRLGGVMRFVEIYLVISGLKLADLKNRTLIVVFFLFFESIMLVKNISAYIEQGSYKDSVTIINYPYISVLNEREIYSVRRVNNVYLTS